MTKFVLFFKALGSFFSNYYFLILGIIACIMFISWLIKFFILSKHVKDFDDLPLKMAAASNHDNLSKKGVSIEDSNF